MEEIEVRAEQVLAGLPGWVWDGEKLPVPVEDIADSQYSLLVQEKSPEEMCSIPGAPTLGPGQSLSGLLLASRGEIWVNADEAREWPPRKRFTIGHELGHWIMHRKPGQQSLFCRHGSIDPAETSEQDADSDQLSIEDEANIFSAALTMPAHLMREHYERLKHEPDCHAQMCELFAASGAAMGRRLHAVV